MKLHLAEHPPRTAKSDQNSAVICMHGSPTPPEYFDPVVQRLTSHLVLVAHFPGYGVCRSERSPDAIEAVNDLLLQELEVRQLRRVAIIGYSVGAYRGLRLAQTAPSRVSNLYLLGALPGLIESEQSQFGAFVDLLRSSEPLPDLAPARFLSEASRKRSPELADAVRGWLSAAPRQVIADELEALMGAPSLLEAVPGMSCAITCRVGADDLATPVAKSRAIIERAQRGRLEVVPHAGHALLYEDTEATLASIVAALGA